MEFDRRTRNRPTVTAFAPTLLSNLLPLGGVLWFDWRIGEVLAIYWIEVAVMLLAYSGAALFAERRIVLEGRNLFLPGVNRGKELSESKWGDNPTTINLGGSIPPIYPRNIRIIVMSVVWGLGFLLLPLGSFGLYPVVESIVSPSLIAAVLATIGSHLVELRREFFATKRYEDLSAHMVLEIPCRVIFFAIVFLALATLVGGFSLFLIMGTVREVFGVVPTRGTLEFFFATGVVLGKLVVEWSRFRAENDPDPSGFASWFVPFDPRSE
ncbi:DUF6498-containing protein [Natrialba taiwanensis]|uniref:Uncharacterized protein n=1 Tax=Natrialba taiwanensis DSM 12281 TaxID=1230458 RepID=L9ZJF1_9EURY|nr:DUF6498-containing protein [Natrialba taiwanensis]ELY85298.1 hypothetical protein C484_20697 [Natrialba taiwanensis DSM 12281]